MRTVLGGIIDPTKISNRNDCYWMRTMSLPTEKMLLITAIQRPLVRREFP